MEITEAFLRAGDHFEGLLDDPATVKCWEDPSALQDLTVGGLVVHVLQGLVWLERLVDAPAPADVPVIGAGELTSSFKVATSEDLQSETHRYVRNLAEHGAARPAGATIARFSEVVARLGKRLDREPADRLLDMRPTVPCAIRLDDRLRCEIVEFVVHGDDLAASIGQETLELPAEAVTVAVGVLLDSARHGHGDRAVVRALARRERATGEVFPVL